MTARTTLALIAAAAIATTPIAVQATERASAPVEGESELAGSGMWVLGALVALGIAVAAFTNDDPVSA